MRAVPIAVAAIVVLAVLCYIMVLLLRERRRKIREAERERHRQWLALRPTEETRGKYIGKLREAHVTGQLDLKEYEQRIDAVFAATENIKLAETVKDLELDNPHE